MTMTTIKRVFSSKPSFTARCVHVLWIGPGHRCATCVDVPAAWLAAYRLRVINEWHGRILGVYRKRHPQ